jgi:4-coumarate--CoA ligase
MTIFTSSRPPINLPTNLTIYEFLFNPTSPFSPLHNPSSTLAGYTDALTKERVSWADVAELSTYISTALVKKYGLKPGQAVALFSRNTVWYPVVLFAVLRAGE